MFKECSNFRKKTFKDNLCCSSSSSGSGFLDISWEIYDCKTMFFGEIRERGGKFLDANFFIS